MQRCLRRQQASRVSSLDFTPCSWLKTSTSGAAFTPQLRDAPAPSGRAAAPLGTDPSPMSRSPCLGLSQTHNPDRGVGFWQWDLPHPAAGIDCHVSSGFGVPAPCAAQPMLQQQTLHQGFLLGSRDGMGWSGEGSRSGQIPAAGVGRRKRHLGPCGKGGAGSALAWGDESCLPGCPGHGHTAPSWHQRAGAC